MDLVNKEVIQSYIMTTAKYDYNKYEKRILYRVVEACQKYLNGKSLDSSFKISQDLFESRTIEMPVSMVLNGENDKNHFNVRLALKRLRNKTFEYDDGVEWSLVGVIEKPKLNRYESMIKFEVQKPVFDAIVSFSKGYRKYELKVAMEFNSVYAMRFYELFSEKKTPIEYRIESLKYMFGLKQDEKIIIDQEGEKRKAEAFEKYMNRPSEFIRYVVEPARKEMDDKSPYSFTYKPIKKGRKIVNIRFFPRYIAKNKDLDLEQKKLKKQMSLRWELPLIAQDYLKLYFDFTDKEIKNNLGVFAKAAKEIDLMLVLSQLKVNLNEDIKNKKGWIINAIKKQLDELKSKNQIKH